MEEMTNADARPLPEDLDEIEADDVADDGAAEADGFDTEIYEAQTARLKELTGFVQHWTPYVHNEGGGVIDPLAIDGAPPGLNVDRNRALLKAFRAIERIADQS